MNDYRVNLDVYNGPLDLLLYLIRRDEIDIYDIPIAHVTGQYIQYVDLLHEVDPNLAGEFLVLAASLMEIKTRMLLPAAPEEPGTETGLGIDPRAELVRQLLQYKAFKDAAGELAASAELQAMKFPRNPAVPNADQTEFDLEDVQVWDLLDAFSKLMTSIGQQARHHQVIYDDTPVELHATDIMDRLNREGPLSFRQVFEGRTTRSEIVGLFLALLELVRQKRIFARQEDNFGDIQIHANPNPPPLEADEHVAQFADGRDAEEAAGPVSPMAGATMESAADVDAPQQESPNGQYVSDAQSPQPWEPPTAAGEQENADHDDDSGTTDQGIGA